MFSKIFSHFFILFSSKAKKGFYQELIKLIGYCPTSFRLYEKAFIHRSATITLEDGKVFNNERLEFLGDAVIDTIISDYLFNYYPNKDEGFLTKLRAKVVKRHQLNLVAKELKIDKLLVAQSNLAENKHIYGNALEALIGAIFVDKGYQKAKDFFIKHIILKYINLDDLKDTEYDFKSRLIEWSQKCKKSVSFNSIEELDEVKNTPVFYSQVFVNEIKFGEGTGKSKKEAEQNAARKTLVQLKEIE